MTGQPKSDPPEKMDQAIQDAMAAAEAAVSAVRGEDEAVVDVEEKAVEEEAPESLDDETVELKARVEELEQEVASIKDRWLRAVADHENAKKRAKRETQESINRALMKLLSDLLPVGDNLDRALAAANPDDQLAQGVRMVKGVFDNALAKNDILPISTEGEGFDPAVHDALQQVDSPDHAPGEIIQEFERGYTRGGKLLRPARVIVAGPGSAATKSHPPDEAELDFEDGAESEVTGSGEEQ